MCKQCTKEYRNEPINKERRTKSNKTYYSKNKDRFKEYYVKNRDSIRDYALGPRGKLVRLKYKYGVTKEEYTVLYKKQGGKCAICGKELIWLGTNTHLDHDHKTERVRGILCRDCNFGLGYLETKDKLKSALEYLQ